MALAHSDCEIIDDCDPEGLEPRMKDLVSGRAEAISDLKAICKDYIGRKTVLAALRNYHGLVGERAYDLLTGLCVTMLSECEREKDIENTRGCMVVVQNFYTEAGRRVLLLEAVKEHPIWGNLSIWEGVIISSISLESRGIVGTSAKELVACQLSCFRRVMRIFGVSAGENLLKEMAMRIKVSDYLFVG